MTGRERVKSLLQFKGADRLAYDLDEKHGTDFYRVDMDPSPDQRPASGPDQWGCVWEKIGSHMLGEVKGFPLKDWADFKTLRIPDITDPRRWESVKDMRKKAGDKFIMAFGVSLYERLHYLRGLENAWTDLYEYREEVEKLLDIFTDQNLKAAERYAKLGADGMHICDDWGLQTNLMISPVLWREMWKPRYAKVFKACHDLGMNTFMHSCGYIVDILDDLVEAGLDVIHQDQQENMTVELLGRRFGGRLTFFCPVDIQNTLARGNLDEVRAYARRMVKHLSTPKGGFMPRWYRDPLGAGHKAEAVDAMCDEFVKLANEWGKEHGA